MLKALAVAIDGPAGAGKSTVSKLLAAKTGFALLDTGAMYRAFAWAYMMDLSQAPDLDIEESVSAHSFVVDFVDGATKVTCDGRDISADIRSAPVTALVSLVSANPFVRTKAVALQRKLVDEQTAGQRGVILEGRDIGTTVLPHAPIKFYLTASDDVRARRRAKEVGADEEQIKELIVARDLADTSRNISPLRKAADAIEIDATSLSVDEVVELMYQKIRDVS